MGLSPRMESYSLTEVAANDGPRRGTLEKQGSDDCKLTQVTV